MGSWYIDMLEDKRTQTVEAMFFLQKAMDGFKADRAYGAKRMTELEQQLHEIEGKIKDSMERERMGVTF